ncbi:arylsulfatase [Sporosarcina sp. P37]|uniref:sulfatase-like hydrolase/transferase n=1 Tax=unclassified Sporosarcina TaxID=2647733 RepID=UPI000A17A983|nr:MULTISPECIES: sulfatase-like hydrolase/transferase [unclassified Sporosarcina]ARK25364.1 arylsulfatase [Sporosarcina sp. P37]PID19081.1 arylsulfatase [Sporosarcina sp. P35]
MTSEFHYGESQPNILFLMVDQDRFPPVYETKDLQRWRRKNLVAQELLRKNGLSFLNHYAASTACSPSRTSLYTGHYPSLHGVTQTPGAAKGSFDADLFWLDPNTVPTIGDYFRAAGYKTFWKGKWHASEPDILIPGTKNSLPSYDQQTGVPNKKNERIYRKADRLNEYGFSEWIGPDPHGADPRNSASSAGTGTSGRDEVYAADAVKLIKQLDKDRHCDKKDTPWFIQCSFVNPHDIALYGMFSAISPNFTFEVDPTLPFIPPAPTVHESLQSKPMVQESYRQTYPKGLQPIHDNNFYRQLYYSLQKEVDNELLKVITALQQSSFFDNTIIVFTSDHGEQLDAHGGLYQKWYTMYEESIHVPLIIHSPKLFHNAKSTNMLTSHVDILPTLLGLAGIDAASVQRKLSRDHTEAQPLVGRNLTPLFYGRDQFFRANEPLYFMTEDNVFKGLNQTNPITGRPYEQVVQPSSIEAVFASLPTGCSKEHEIWKFARYFDNPQFWTDPGVSDTTLVEKDGCLVEAVKTEPAGDQFELYNLAEDPLETNNLADPANATDESKVIRCKLEKLLADERGKKRLGPGRR